MENGDGPSRGWLPPPEARPAVSADVAAFQLRSGPEGQGKALHVLLVRRGEPPFLDRWALLGGFLRAEESLPACAMREIREETGIAPAALMSVGVYSAPDRDPRGRVITQAFAAVIGGEESPRGGDDAADAVWFRLQRTAGEREIRLLLDRGETRLDIRVPLDGDARPPEGSPPGLAFDHGIILADAVALLRAGAARVTSVFRFLPRRFTLTQLQQAAETLTGTPLSAANFRRKIMPWVEPLPEFTRGDRHRPAQLYRARSGQTDPQDACLRNEEEQK